MHNDFHVLIMNGPGAILMGFLIGFGAVLGALGYFTMMSLIRQAGKLVAWIGAAAVQWVAGAAMKLGRRA